MKISNQINNVPGRMSNSLSDKQKDRLYQWLRGENTSDLSRTMAAEIASDYLGFNVTYTNMRSAEEVTGISLVKPPKAKESFRTDHEARIAKLESDMAHVVGILKDMQHLI